VEDFSVEAFVAQLAVERFTVTVFPWASGFGFNVERPGAKRCEPVAHDLCRYLRAVIRADVFRHTTLRPAWLAHDPAGVTYRETVLLPNALHCLPAPLGAICVVKGDGRVLLELWLSSDHVTACRGWLAGWL